MSSNFIASVIVIVVVVPQSRIIKLNLVVAVVDVAEILFLQRVKGKLFQNMPGTLRLASRKSRIMDEAILRRISCRPTVSQPLLITSHTLETCCGTPAGGAKLLTVSHELVRVLATRRGW